MDQSYNGFDATERRAAAARIRNALANGSMSFASACSVCRRELSPPHEWHLEDYRDVASAYPICRRCHHAIHIRFHLPLFWQRFLTTMSADSWVHSLALDAATRDMEFDDTYSSGTFSDAHGSGIG